MKNVDRIRQPTFFIWGEHDEFGTLSDLRAAYPVLPEHFTFHVVAGDDHFFKPNTRELEHEVWRWATAQLEGAPQR
jgi:predicted alpha/beta-hydrolase family hydrolase